MLPPKLFSLFIAPLNRLGITYMVTGGVASIIYGEPRLTIDIDLVLTLSSTEIPQLHAAFDETEFYIPPLEVMQEEASRSAHGHFNIIHHDTQFRADVYLAGTSDVNRRALDHRQHVLVGDEYFWVCPPEYVIVNKLLYFRDGGSSKHLTDIRTMLRVLGEGVDRVTLATEIRTLGLDQEWEQVDSV